ncbi:MAG TPA: complex I NDUFA9 subunit family protein [Burkholderiales bacterium]|jgi:NADH dehydrogenase|nr:complex I NDUFA9 subunit family protein [Burkholderiales bacterium]
MHTRNVLLIGGSGLIGSAIARILTTNEIRVTVTTRNRERAKHLILLPTVEVVEADVHDPAQLAQLMRGQDAVINLVGVLQSRRGDPYGPQFKAAHVDLARAVAQACVTAGVPRLLHFSALGASAQAPSMYLRSKAAGEAAVLEFKDQLALTIFRPSVVFGQGDKFLGLFASLQAMVPVFPLGRGNAKLQPIWVEDVAQAAVNALDKREVFGETCDLAGPKSYTLRQLVEYAGAVSGNPRPVIALPDSLAYLQAWLMEFLPNPPIIRDNLDSLKIDNLMSGDIAPELGVIPVSMEAEAPLYLAGQNPRARLGRYRDHAGR